jgi:methionine-rich copper-binding protein CopC
MGMLKAVIALGGVIILCPWPRVAWCHAFPDHSEPRVGAVLSASPDRVRIWFDGALEPAFSTVRVQNASGQQMDKGNGHVDGADATLLEVGLPPLAPGTYRVIWSVVARDGHRTEGDFNFTIR